MGLVGLLFGGDWAFDQAFLDDRSALIGQPFDPAQFAAARPQLTLQFRQHLDLLETQLADGRAFMTGDAPDAIDAAVFAQTAFARWGKGAAAALIDASPRLCAWEERVRALGHGARGADIERETAITVARDAGPRPIARGGGDGDFAPGEAVSVKFHDASTPPLEGELLRVDLHSLSLRPALSEAGEIHVHMPRSVGTIARR
jgi:hypothetical protein